jgi:hypothetical protein
MTPGQEQAPLLTPEVAVYLHPIDVRAHPSTGGGWRWAVHAGGQGPSELRYCANAGRTPSRQQAALIGESHGAAATKALRILGVPAAYRGIRELDHDPIPPELDPPVGVWRDQQAREG